MTRWSQEKIGKSDAFWAAAPLSGADVDQGAGADRHHRHHHPLPVSGEVVGARIAGLLFGELLEEQVESELLSGRKYWRNKTEIIEQLLIRGEGGSRTDGVAEVLKSFMGNSRSNQQAGFFLDSSAHCTDWYCHMDPRPISLEEGLVFCKLTKKQTENSWWLCLSECLFMGAIELLIVRLAFSLELIVQFKKIILWFLVHLHHAKIGQTQALPALMLTAME